jgi:hypothetical protein
MGVLFHDVGKGLVYAAGNVASLLPNRMSSRFLASPSLLRYVTMTSTPFLANAKAVFLPISLLAPVTHAIFALSCVIALS